MTTPKIELGSQQYKLKVLPTSYVDTVVGAKQKKLYTNIYKTTTSKKRVVIGNSTLVTLY